MISIKDVCSTLGVTATTIRLYEKYLRSIPWHIEDNGYRGFYFENLLFLLDKRALTQYGIPIKEAFDVNDSESEKTLLATQKKILETNYARIGNLIESISEDCALLDRIPHLMGSYEIVEIPAFLYLDLEKNGEWTEKRELQLTWSNAIPFAHYTPHYHTSMLHGEKINPMEVSLDNTLEKHLSDMHIARLGWSISPRFSHLVETNSPFVRLVPKCKCLATVVTMDGISHPPSSETFKGMLPFDFATFKKIFGTMRNCLQAENATLTGDIFTRLIDSHYEEKRGHPEDECRQFFYAWTPLDCA